MNMIKKILAGSVFVVAACSALPVMAQTYPADKPELEYLDYWRLDTNYPTLSNYKDGLTKSPTELNAYTDTLFRVITGGGVQMDARFGGAVTTTGTAYPRTELREMASSTTEAAWACKSKAKMMTVQLRIKKTPKYKPEMSVAQIHDTGTGSSDNLEVLYVYDKTQNADTFPATGAIGDKGKIIVKLNGGRSASQTLDSSYVVGDTILLKVHANDTFAGVGNMAVEYKNVTQSKSSSSTAVAFDDGTKTGCYFKAGNYAQACTKSFIDKTENPTCTAKKFPLSSGFTWEPDTAATRADISTLVLYNLTVTPKGN